MLQQKFYHSTIRKAIIAFGNLFNNIHIDRKDSDGTVVQALKVPLTYSPRQKFIARIEAEPNLPDESFQVLIPRMGFEMTSIAYDSARRVSMMQQSRAINSSQNTLNSQYSPTPYNLQISLYIYVKNQDDGLQIVEQILPFFNPDFNVTINSVPDLNIKNDIPIILDSVDYSDDYEGDFTQRRAIIWTLSFTMKVNFYGPINKQSLIRKSIVNTYSDVEMSNIQSRYTVEVSPSTAVPGDDITFIEQFEDF